jgi:hypothetical protein
LEPRLCTRQFLSDIRCRPLINAEEVEAYLRENGVIEVSEDEVCTAKASISEFDLVRAVKFGPGVEECQGPRSKPERKGHYLTSEVAVEIEAHGFVVSGAPSAEED